MKAAIYDRESGRPVQTFEGDDLSIAVHVVELDKEKFIAYDVEGTPLEKLPLSPPRGLPEGTTVGTTSLPELKDLPPGLAEIDPTPQIQYLALAFAGIGKIRT